jgi:2,4-diketo-3-deoxy-L-fuconate hydrolase
MFGVGTFASGDDVYPGLVLGGAVVDLRPYFDSSTTTADLLGTWDSSLAQLHKIAQDQGVTSRPIDELRVLPPVQPIGQVFCAGANFASHLREMSFMVLRSRPGELTDEQVWAEADAIVKRQIDAKQPFMFAAQSGALSGADDDVILWGPGVEHDWELELAVVIGRVARDVSADEALDYVAGYTTSNDISTRDVIFRPDFPLSDFMMSKLRPTFFPTGPYIVPREFVPDYHELRMTLKLNGEVMQDETVQDIMYGVEELVSYASSVTQLQPGDMLLTGSPAGNAAVHGNRWLRPGDVIESEISGLGTQRNVCLADPRTDRSVSGEQGA